MKGKVIWFNDAKGYGFIKPDGQDEDKGDLFFYWSYLQMDGFKTVKPDSVVSFEIGDNHRGPMAVRIEIEQAPEETETE